MPRLANKRINTDAAARRGSCAGRWAEGRRETRVARSQVNHGEAKASPVQAACWAATRGARRALTWRGR